MVIQLLFNPISGVKIPKKGTPDIKKTSQHA